MTGRVHFNFLEFDNARDRLLEEGFEVFNPADHDRFLLDMPPNWLPEENDTEGPWLKWKDGSFGNAPSLRDMLGADLNWIAKNASHIYMLKGWEKSRGAIAEHALAVALGLEIIYE